MNLTAEQVAAAEAAGCRFIPVPPDALHRYAMQRKLFRLDGQEMLATCGGGLYETASTLDRLIAIGRGRLPTTPPPPSIEAPRETAADAPVAVVITPAPVRAVVVDAEAVEPGPEVTDTAPEPTAAPVPRRRPRAPRAATPAVEPSPVVEPAEATDGAPRPESRARKPAGAARWATAGAERRGRTDQHWSKRGR